MGEFDLRQPEDGLLRLILAQDVQGKDALPFFEACRTMFSCLLEFPNFEGIAIEYTCLDGLFFEKVRELLMSHYKDLLTRLFPDAGDRALAEKRLWRVFRRCCQHVLHVGLEWGACA